MGKIRSALGVSLINSSDILYKFTRLLCACILKPDDLTALTRHAYSLPGCVKGGLSPEYIDSGLDETETYFVRRYTKPKEKILVVGCGSGREAIALAKLGYAVTGVDFVQAHINTAMAGAMQRGVKIDFIHGDISRLQLTSHHRFNAVLFSAWLYSLLPSAKKRLDTLTSIQPHLSPDGKVFLSFLARDANRIRFRTLRKAIAYLTLGNIGSEDGDSVEGDGEFKHYFSKTQIGQEIARSGFRLEELKLDATRSGFAVLSKP